MVTLSSPVGAGSIGWRVAASLTTLPSTMTTWPVGVTLSCPLLAASSSGSPAGSAVNVKASIASILSATSPVPNFLTIPASMAYAGVPSTSACTNTTASSTRSAEVCKKAKIFGFFCGLGAGPELRNFAQSSVRGSTGVPHRLIPYRFCFFSLPGTNGLHG